MQNIFDTREGGLDNVNKTINAVSIQETRAGKTFYQSDCCPDQW